jgi:hypothetical protein
MKMMTYFEWPYFKLGNDGRLYNEAGRPMPGRERFQSTADAEHWLIDHNIRGSVRELLAKKDEVN